MLAVLALAAAWVVAVFGAAGSRRWLTGWIYIFVLAVGLLLHRTYVARHNPDLLKKRQSIYNEYATWVHHRLVPGLW